MLGPGVVENPNIRPNTVSDMANGAKPKPGAVAELRAFMPDFAVLYSLKCRSSPKSITVYLQQYLD